METMELSGREKDLFQSLIGTAKSAASLAPVLGQAIAGWDAYHRSRHDRNVKKLLDHLKNKVESIESFFQEEWLCSEEGEQFLGKIIDSTLDAQLEDKQELFVNAFIHGVYEKEIDQLEKLKFVDMLRHLSRSSLMVLADMDDMFASQVRGPNRTPEVTSAFPRVDAESIAEKLSSKYDPYLVTASVKELDSQGLFSKTGEWGQNPDGTFRAGGGFATELCYTHFSARFAEFIREPS